MKNFFPIAFFILALCGFSFAQSSFPEFEIAKEIKLLKSTRSDVEMIMTEFDFDEADESYNQQFHSENASVKVSYSTGNCLEDAGLENRPDWNVPEMTSTKVVINFEETTKLKELMPNLSGYKKKLRDDDDEDSKDYIYYNENAGIIILTDDGEVEKIILHPPKKQIGYLCDNQNNSEILSGKTSLVSKIVNSDYNCILINIPANVNDLSLKTNDYFGCKEENCIGAKKEISVTTTAVDAENDVLTYNYAITGGTIVGNGFQVIWDLAGASPGIYQITVGTDDGCGVCGQTKSRKILVKENSYEFVPPATIKKLTLDKTELIAACPAGRLKRTRCPLGNCEISVASLAEAPDNQNLIYKYEAFGGKVIGSGAQATWDLTGLTPGKYSIEVSASDDGIVFGNPEKATIEIKENQYCSSRKEIAKR